MASFLELDPALRGLGAYGRRHGPECVLKVGQMRAISRPHRICGERHPPLSISRSPFPYHPRIYDAVTCFFSPHFLLMGLSIPWGFIVTAAYAIGGAVTSEGVERAAQTRHQHLGGRFGPPWMGQVCLCLCKLVLPFAFTEAFAIEAHPLVHELQMNSSVDAQVTRCERSADTLR